MPIPLEICIDSLTSGLVALPYLRPGDRFEVCASLLSGGGLTPSMGLVLALKRHCPDIGLMTMIRPRPGSFIYTPTEVEVMLADISAAKDVGATGVVFGCLTEDGEVDVPTATRLAAAAAPLEVTFHRAFDVTPEWRRACDDIASVPGITRILTSGHAFSALDGAAELDALSRYAPRHLTILPASGINATTLAALRSRAPLLEEAHLSASGAVEPTASPAVARGEVLGFGREEWRLDEDKLHAVRELIEKDR